MLSARDGDGRITDINGMTLTNGFVVVAFSVFDAVAAAVAVVDASGERYW
jgi:hypothetical protein